MVGDLVYEMVLHTYKVIPSSYGTYEHMKWTLVYEMVPRTYEMALLTF